MHSSPTELKFFSSLSPYSYDLKLPSNATQIQYTYDISKASTEEKEEDPPNSYPVQIHYISMQKLFELLASFEYQDPEIFNTMLYGLIERFRMCSPLNLSKNEEELFKKKIIKTIQLKIIIFFQHWFKNQKNSLIYHDFEVETMFIEALYCLFNLKQEKWLNDPMNRFFNELEDIDFMKLRESKRKKKLFTTFLPSFVNKGLLLIKSRKKELAQCISLYDQANFEKISIRELLNRGKRCDSNRNYYRFIDSFNFLAKFVGFLLLNFTQTYPRIEFFEDLIDLIEELRRLHNFHSSYSLFLGISYPAISRLKPILHNKLSKNYKNKLEILTELFDNQTKFSEVVNNAVLPCIPSLNLYTKELVWVEENFKMQKKNDNAMIDFIKLSKQAAVVKKIELYRTCRYVFSKKYNEDFVRDFEYLPNIEEEMLYDLSKKILP